MYIYIEIEIVKRELSGKLLIALDLINKGHTVILADRESINKIAKEKKVPQGVIFLKDLNNQDYRLNDYKKFVKNGFKIVSQDEEIGCFVDKSFEKFYSWRFRGNRSFKFIEKYFCWGNFDFDYLKIIEQKGKCVKTGSPRIDIAIENNTKKQLIKNKKKILICLNHNLFWKRDFIERSVIDLEGLNEAKTKEKIDSLYSNESKDLLLFSYLIKLIIKLSSLNNINIKIRPHPTHDIEKLKYYFQSISMLKNIKIEIEEDLIHDISKSDFVIQTGCTSSIEGTLNKKKIIFYSPKNNYLKNYRGNNFISEIGNRATTIEEVINLINSKNNELEKFVRKIDKDINKVGKRVMIDRKSFKRISNEINKINIEDKKKINLRKLKDNLVSIGFKNFKFYLKSKIKKRIGISNSINVFESKFPPFDQKKISIQIKKLKKQFKIKSKFKIDKINDRFLILSKN